jgi:hypothetical protein
VQAAIRAHELEKANAALFGEWYEISDAHELKIQLDIMRSRTSVASRIQLQQNIK